MTTIWPFAQAGAVRALAVSTPQRAAAARTCRPSAKRCPAMRRPPGRACSRRPEPAPGRRGHRGGGWRIWKLPDVSKALQAVGAEPVTTTPDEFTQYTQSERAKWARWSRPPA